MEEIKESIQGEELQEENDPTQELLDEYSNYTDDDLNELYIKTCNEHLELEDHFNTLKYTLNVKDKKTFDYLYNYVKNHAQWNVESVVSIATINLVLKEEKKNTAKKDWDGNIQLGPSSSGILFRILMQIEGQGYEEAKKYIDVSNQIREDLRQIVIEAQKEAKKLQEKREYISRLEYLFGLRELSLPEIKETLEGDKNA